MSVWLSLFSLELAVLLVAAMVLLLDAFEWDDGRALGYLVAACLGGIFVASFFVETGGAAPHDVYVSGPFVTFFRRVFLAAALLAVLGSIEWLDKNAPRRPAEYHALILFSTLGMMILPGARDWVLLVVAFELMGIPLYVLAAYAKNDAERSLAAEAALKLFVTGATSSAITLFGLAFVYGLSGTTAIKLGGAPTPLLATGMLLIVAGFGFKIGAVPFHLWVPDTYQGAPPPFVAFLSVAPKAAGLAALMTILMAGWQAHLTVWKPAIVGLAAASMVVGNLFALPQADLRRLLAFSGVGQIGYVLMALAASSELGVSMALFFIAAYVFTNVGVFLVAGVAAEAHGGFTLAALKGLSKRSPWLGASLLVFLLSLAGIPFALGFWAKLFVFLAAYRAGLVELVIVGVVFTIVGLFYYLTVARSTFMADGESSEPIKTPFAPALAISLCLLAVLGLGLWPKPLADDTTAASAAFVRSR